MSSAAAAVPWIMLSGMVLASGKTVCSSNHQVCLAMQSNGNLTLYNKVGSKALFSSNTSGHPGATAVMSVDGNFVVYAKGRKSVLWASNTGGHPGALAVVRDDGSLAVYDASGTLWASSDRTQQIIDAANALAALKLPYQWGGGHGTPAVPDAGNPPGLDCAGAVNYVLQHAGFNIPSVDAGDYATFGNAPPAGTNYMKGAYLYIVQPNVHVFMRINGRTFESTGPNGSVAGGPRWSDRTDFSLAPGAQGPGTTQGIVREIPQTSD